MRLTAPFVLLCLATATSGAGATFVHAVPVWHELQGQDLVFSANVEMETLSVAVFDSDDRPVAGLTAGDFALREDGVEHEVVLALAPTETPLDIAFVVDFSGSIAEDAPYAQTAEVAFLRALSPVDCVFVLPFNQRVGVGVWGRPHDPRLTNLLARTIPRGGTALYDAMIHGFSALRDTSGSEEVRSPGSFRLVANGQTRGASTPEPGVGAHRTTGPAAPPAEAKLVYRPDHECGPDIRGGTTGVRRQAMVVLTDGMDTTSYASHAGALDATRQAGMPVIAVGAGAAVGLTGFSFGRRSRMGFGARAAMRDLEHQWREFARVSGGKFITGKGSLARLQAAYDEALDLLRASYLIGYHPTTERDAGLHPEELVWHEVEVKLRNHDLRAVTREGYYRSGVDRGAAALAIASATRLLEEGHPEVALAAVDRAVAADPFFWQAHYYRAIVLALLERGPDAHSAVERAVELNPGNNRVHKLAWLIAYTGEDQEAAWEHAIRARQAGGGMTEELALLRRRGPVPADLEARLAAPKMFVADSPADDLVLRATVKRVYRGLRRVVSEASGIALVDDPRRASYVVIFDDERVKGRAPRKFEANLALYDATGRRLWKHKVKVVDIDDATGMERALRPAVAKLQERITENSGAQ